MFPLVMGPANVEHRQTEEGVVVPQNTSAIAVPHGPSLAPAAAAEHDRQLSKQVGFCQQDVCWHQYGMQYMLI